MKLSKNDKAFIQHVKDECKRLGVKTHIKDVKYVKTNRVDTIIKKFFELDLISRRKMLINLFTYNSDNEVQYIAYMLYDLIGSADNIDGAIMFSTERSLLFAAILLTSFCFY